MSQSTQPSSDVEFSGSVDLEDVADVVMQLDEGLKHVALKQKEWRCLTPAKRLELLNECIQIQKRFTTKYNLIAMTRRNYDKYKGHFSYDVESALVPFVGSWQSLQSMLSLQHCLKSLVSTGKFAEYPVDFIASESPKCIVQMPLVPYDSKMFANATLSLWLECSKQDKIQCDSDVICNDEDGISVVVGAGSYDAPMDLLTALFKNNTVTIYEAYPKAYATVKLFSTIFRPLVDRGYLVFCMGNFAALQKTLYDPRVTHWVMTGGSTTAYKMLYGCPVSPFAGREPSEQLKHEVRNRLLYYGDKHITFELGGVSPYIICPDIWTQEEMSTHAKHLAFALLFNGGHICVHPQIIITSQQWPQREQFFAELKKEIQNIHCLPSFYPKSHERYQALKERLISEGSFHEQDEWRQGDCIFVRNCPSTSFMLKEETFCHIAAEVPLKEDDFIHEAVKLCNTQIKGTLGVTIISKENAFATDQIEHLKYGVVSVNVWVIIAAMSGHGLWGSYRHLSSLAHLGSGIGHFGNCFHYNNPLKSVVVTPMVHQVHQIMRFPMDKAELESHQNLCKQYGLI